MEIILHNSAQYIGGNIIPRMAEMGVIVNCRPAGVPSDFPARRIFGDKRRFRSCQRVPDLERGKIAV